MKKNTAFVIVLFYILLINSGCRINPATTKMQVSSSTALQTASATPVASATTAAPTAGETPSPTSTSELTLVASLPENGIYLYMLPEEGMLLVQEDTQTQFMWPGLTPREILPELFYKDFNSDGQAELAVILFVDSGTQCAMMDLHILEISKNANTNKYTYVDHALVSSAYEEHTPSNFDNYFCPNLTYTIANANHDVTLHFNGASYTIPNPYVVAFESFGYSKDELQQKLNEHMDTIEYFGRMELVYFTFDVSGDILVEVPIAVNYQDFGCAEFIATVTAKVRFIGHDFAISDYQLTIEEEYLPKS